jgi:hypothetical protein
MARLRVEDIHLHYDDLTVIDVNDRDGVPIFEVPVLPRHTHVVLSAIAGRDPEALVFPQLPRALSLQPFRVQYARELYRYALAHNDVGYDEEDCVEYVLDTLCLQQRHLELVRGYFLGLCQARKSR